MRMTRKLMVAVIAGTVLVGCQQVESPLAPVHSADASPRHDGLGWEGSGHRTAPDSTTSDGEISADKLAAPSGLGWTGSGH